MSLGASSNVVSVVVKVKKRKDHFEPVSEHEGRGEGAGDDSILGPVVIYPRLVNEAHVDTDRQEFPDVGQCDGFPGSEKTAPR